MMNLCSECPRFDFVETCDCECDNQLYNYERVYTGDGKILKIWFTICYKCKHAFNVDDRKDGDER